MARTLFKAGAGVALSAGILLASLPAAAGGGAEGIPLAGPGKGVSLNVGGKHVMSYFEAKDGGCSLTIVMAAVEGGMAGNDTPGTRFNVLVSPGKALRIDAADSKSADFTCDAAGKEMAARLFDSAPYNSMVK